MSYKNLRVFHFWVASPLRSEGSYSYSSLLERSKQSKDAISFSPPQLDANYHQIKPRCAIFFERLSESWMTKLSGAWKREQRPLKKDGAPRRR
ncbi:hypothetical protein QWZ13_00360 [Reinekea marina]|uniref:hypothetical protein n=1 Tax=Reinekea marina TaxID=1310421 RepID=UPI0025B5077E|nr:hypothetical protein [Reinekea marina]MDN3647354.1 hypothetical protein [Reinekea marina]